jgi:exosortase D (VPLPA-CTERM-specific)
MTERARSPYISLIAGAALALGILGLYWGVLVDLAVKLAQDEDYSFGLLLPFVSIYIVYTKWPQVRSLPWRPSWGGLAIISLALGLYTIGKLGQVVFLLRFSLVLLLAGLILLIGGLRLLRFLGFPLFLLLLMIPPPFSLIINLTLPLQLLSSQLATGVLRGVGIPVLRHGNIIDLGNRQLEVAAACSGLRYIHTLLALGCIFCYFYQRQLWKVAVILAALLPTAILANALRVGGMALFPALEEGFWHLFSGWLIFVVCFAFLILINWLLNRLQSPKPISVPAEKEAWGDALPGRRPLGHYLVPALFLVLLTVPCVHYGSKVKTVPLRQSFDHFPLQLGPWQGHHTYTDPNMVKAVGADAHLSAEYRYSGEGAVSLWIAYYEKGERYHTPKYCLPGGGWQTLESGTINIAHDLPVNYLLMGTANERILVYYWYLLRGRWIANTKLHNFFSIYDMLFLHRKDGALIRLITPVRGDLNKAQQLLSNFAGQLVTVLPDFLPYQLPK